MPKYAPPPPKPAADNSSSSPILGHGGPKNRIYRLPAVVVEGERPPVFTEGEIHTQKGLGELAVKRYIPDVVQAMNSLTLPFFGRSLEAIAIDMWREDERLRHLSEIGAQIDNLRFNGQDDEAKELKRLADDTLVRKAYWPDPTPFNRDAQGN